MNSSTLTTFIPDELMFSIVLRLILEPITKRDIACAIYHLPFDPLNHNNTLCGYIFYYCLSMIFQLFVPPTLVITIIV